MQAVPPVTDNRLLCNRVIDWRAGAIKIHVWSPELEDLLSLIENKRERNDSAGLEYNTRRYLQVIGRLADEALHDLAQTERDKHVRLVKGCYLLGAIAVVSAPLSIAGLIVPAALTMVAIECLNLRMNARVADILSFRIGGDHELKLVSSPSDLPAEDSVKIPSQKGGSHD